MQGMVLETGSGKKYTVALCKKCKERTPHEVKEHSSDWLNQQRVCLQCGQENNLIQGMQEDLM